ncbi:MAG: murein transglycosylase [Flavobacteriales bacterium]|nr:murein transglycosylase [Flavobacteriales bacterium]|tara:strand:+ start:9076 stop:9969 length:894 start_codon:yes stop_codon:yes gene_type:complete
MKSSIISLIAGAVLTLAVLTITSASPEQLHSAENAASTVRSFELPQSLSIAGEELPLSSLDIQERLDREILVNSYWQSNNLLMLKRSDKWFPIIETILKEEGIPDDFKYLALIESGLQNIVSPAGAAGPWQIMKSTGREKGLQIDNEIDQRYHLEKATRAACSYLNEAYERFDNWTLAAASYNMGMSGTANRLQEQRVDNYYDLRLNNETARYIFRIAAVKHIHEHLSDYGYIYHNNEGYQLPAFDTVMLDSPVSSWVNWAEQHDITYKELRLYNPWIRSNKLTNSANNTYALLVAK